MDSNAAEQNLSTALQLRAAGRLDEAERFCRQALGHEPANHEALHLLGWLLHQRNQPVQAVEAIGAAIAVCSSFGPYYHSLALALADTGRIGEAIDAIRRAIELEPDFPEAYNNLGNLLRIAGRVDEAIEVYRSALRFGRDAAAIYNNLGVALRMRGHVEKAIEAFRAGIATAPGIAELHANLGNALRSLGKSQEALAALQTAVRLNPNLGESWNDLGNVLADIGQLDAAIEAYDNAIRLRPGFHWAHNNLGNVLRDQGRPEEAIACYRRAVQMRSDDASVHSNLLYALHFDPGQDGASILAEHREWARRHAESLVPAKLSPQVKSERLRVGYVSPDLRTHPVGRFMLPILERHDRAQFEIHCFSDVLAEDALTSELRSSADAWHATAGLSDEELAALVREQRIDILVDLTLHMARNRMLVFARKPAPVQITYLAYAGTSGLSTMDYRLTDPFIDPAGGSSPYAERSLHLKSYWCYRGPKGIADNSTLPALRNGYVTFVCLNSFSKVNANVLRIWAELLAALPGSRLVLHCLEGSHRKRVLDVFAVKRVEAHRIEFVGRQSSGDYFKTYQRADIALDPFPYVGGTTTCDALWMGVPVITLAGSTAVGRGGVSILNTIGLPQFVAHPSEQYVERAVALARDMAQLSELRQSLRQLMLASPLCDETSFARDIERLYLQAFTSVAAVRLG